MEADREVRGRGRGAFPSDLEGDVDIAFAVLSPASLSPTSGDVGTIYFRGEPLHIPARIYSPESESARTAPLSPRQHDILSCWYTRHHDGFVRHRNAKSLVLSTEPWVAPFIVQLLGEYVVEIAVDLEQHMDRLLAPAFLAFVAENPQYIGLTRQRATSYWDCYYRRRVFRRESYPPLRILEALTQAAAARHAQPG